MCTRATTSPFVYFENRTMSGFGAGCVVQVTTDDEAPPALRRSLAATVDPLPMSVQGAKPAATRPSRLVTLTQQQSSFILSFY